MAQERFRRSGVWKEQIARKRYERMLRLSDNWLTLLVNKGQLLVVEPKGRKQ